MPAKRKIFSRELRRLLAASRKASRWLVRLRGSPREIAGGVAVGMFVAFSPTIGFQMVIAVGIATLLNVNRPAAVVPTLLTNPITIPPVYAFTYYLGSFFWPGPGPGLDTVARAVRAAADELASLDFLSFRAQLETLVQLGVDVFVPMWIGGLILGGFCAAIAYPISLRTVIDLRARRQRSRDRRKERARNQRVDRQ